MNQIVKNKGGRPEVKYPYLWELYHLQWERGDITEKNMMDWLGLKRTTLYKLSNKYKKELYNNKKKTPINHEKLVLEYILENSQDTTINYIDCNKIIIYTETIRAFYIDHNEMTSTLKISSPTIMMIISKLEKKGEIIKFKRGIWKIPAKSQ